MFLLIVTVTLSILVLESTSTISSLWNSDCFVTTDVCPNENVTFWLYKKFVFSFFIVFIIWKVCKFQGEPADSYTSPSVGYHWRHLHSKAKISNTDSWIHRRQRLLTKLPHQATALGVRRCSRDFCGLWTTCERSLLHKSRSKSTHSCQMYSAIHRKSCGKNLHERRHSCNRIQFGSPNSRTNRKLFNIQVTAYYRIRSRKTRIHNTIHGKPSRFLGCWLCRCYSHWWFASRNL